MKLLDRYIISNIMLYIGLALFLTLSIDLIFSFLREYRHLNYEVSGVSNLFAYLVLTIPKRIYRVFPMVSLLGTLMGLSSLALKSELIIMRQAGCSIARIAKPVMLIAFVITLLITMIGEWVLPTTEEMATNMQNRMQGNNAYSSGGGFWLRDGHNFIYINHVLPGGEMRGLVRYELDEELVLKEMDQAETAKFHKNHWQLKNVDSLIYMGDGTVKENDQAEAQWPSLLKPSLLDFLHADPEDLSIRGLWQYVKYMQVNELDGSSYALAAWIKIFQPLSTMVMVFLAIPFVFGPLRSSSMGLRTLVGIGAGFGFYMMNQVFGHVALIYDFPPAIIALLPSLLVFASSLILMRRMP